MISETHGDCGVTVESPLHLFTYKHYVLTLTSWKDARIHKGGEEEGGQEKEVERAHVSHGTDRDDQKVQLIFVQVVHEDVADTVREKDGGMQ